MSRNCRVKRHVLLSLVFAIIMSACLAQAASAGEGEWNGGYEEDDVDLTWFTENQEDDVYYI